MGTLRLRAHAKVNLFLRIVGVRTDGYHDIESVVVPLELHDVVEITATCGPLTVSADWDEVPDGEGNLCHRAAAAYDRATGLTSAVAVGVNKSIPVAAGLGGGSADAAATLMGLNELHDRPLSPEQLTALAAALGADVPLFLAHGPALLEGLGDRVTPLECGQPIHLVLAKPPFGMDTAEAYRLADQYWQRCPFPVEDTIAALQHGDAERVGYALYNDFWGPVAARHPELADIRHALLAAGAFGASITGSGTCLFGVFADAATAAAVEPAQLTCPWVVAARTVPRPIELIAEGDH